MTTQTFRALYGIAEDQMGFITTAQAASVGVQPMALVMMTRRGTLERVSRSVYRIVDFPLHPLAQYMQATLWPYTHYGVLSHETALSLYEMSDVDPVTVHITLPKAFRVQRKIPAYLQIHAADLAKTDVTLFEGMPITTPERSVRDCLASHLGPALIRQAIEDGRRTNRLTHHTANILLSELESSLRTSPDIVKTTSAMARTPRSRR